MSVFAKDLMIAANTAARDYVQGGADYYVRIFDASAVLLVELPMQAGTINATTAVLEWQGSGTANAVASGTPTTGVVVRENTAGSDPLRVSCITLPVGLSGTATVGQIVIDSATITAGNAYSLSYIQLPGQEDFVEDPV